MCSFIIYHAIIIGLTLPRLYPILDTASLARLGLAPEAAAEALLEAGVGLLQFRHKGHFSRNVFGTAERVRDLCRRARALFIVNDRADIARLLDAGLHLGQDDLPPAEARRLLGPAHLIGFSTHNPTQFAAALEEPVDYLAFGPIFPTATKQNPDPVVGLDLLPELARRAHRAGRPLVAIGGITRQRAPHVLAAGADSLAVIGDLLPEPFSQASLRQRIQQWLRLLNPTLA